MQTVFVCSTCVFGESWKTHLFAHFDSIAHKCIILPPPYVCANAVRTAISAPNSNGTVRCSDSQRKTYHRYWQSFGLCLLLAHEIEKRKREKKKKVKFIIVIIFFARIRSRWCMQISCHTFTELRFTFPHERFGYWKHLAFSSAFFFCVTPTLVLLAAVTTAATATAPAARLDKYGQWIRIMRRKIYEIKIWLKKFACKYVCLKDKFIAGEAKKNHITWKTHTHTSAALEHTPLQRLNLSAVIFFPSSIFMNCFSFAKKCSKRSFVSIFFRSFWCDNCRFSGSFLSISNAIVIRPKSILSGHTRFCMDHDDEDNEKEWK